MKNPVFHFHATADGSPTLSAGEQGEWMHHRQGAFSETLYVYGEAIRRVPPGPSPAFLSVGLGLGYVEILLAAHAMQSRTPENFTVLSFEAEPTLRENFLADLQGQAPAPFAAAYEQIYSLFASAFDVPPAKIRECLRQWKGDGRWTLEGALGADTLWTQRYDAILYDAYSSETVAGLWSPEFLNPFLESAAGPRCVFATYAATGELKRTLVRHHFRLEDRPGFCGKRECTLALRP